MKLRELMPREAVLASTTGLALAVGVGTVALGIYHKGHREFQQELEPTAVYEPLNRDYRDIDGNGKRESVFTDTKTGVEYKLERLPSGELKISPTKNQ